MICLFVRGFSSPSPLPETAEATQREAPGAPTNTMSVRVDARAKVLAAKVLGVEKRHLGWCFLFLSFLFPRDRGPF